MSKVTLVFKLPEEKDDLTLAQKGHEFYNLLWHLDQTARSALKYGHADWKTPEDVLEWLRTEIAEGVDLECVR